MIRKPKVFGTTLRLTAPQHITFLVTLDSVPQTRRTVSVRRRKLLIRGSRGLIVTVRVKSTNILLRFVSRIPIGVQRLAAVISSVLKRVPLKNMLGGQPFPTPVSIGRRWLTRDWQRIRLTRVGRWTFSLKFKNRAR